MRAKSFCYVSLGILALALAYHFGATSATAQVPANPVVGITGASGYGNFVVTANGDVYSSNGCSNCPWIFGGNVFNSATPAAPKSWGQVKAEHR